MNKKKAILLAAFGTTVPKAAKAFTRFESSIRERFKDTEIRWAFTSSIVRRKLAERGDKKESIAEALEHLANDGYNKIAVQSLHVIPGIEYNKIHHEIATFKHNAVGQNITVVIGSPLLNSYDDAVRAAEALVKAAPSERLPNEALVFMGHGSASHSADLYYTAFASIIKKLDTHAFVATVEGHPDLSDIITQCKDAKVKKAWLIPFMSVAGDHAINDMASNQDDSWKSILTKEGINCNPVLNGMLDNKEIGNIWLDHLDAILENNSETVKK